MPRLSKPCVKPPHRPLSRPDGRLWIGSVQFGLGKEIDDPSGMVLRCCDLMDGTRSHDEVVTELVSGTSRSRTDGEDVVAFLVDSGWVEDEAGVPPPSLSARDLERHNRSADLLAWMDTTPRSSRFDLQARLKASRVTVLGVGGIGSAVATSLVASGVGHVHCVDADVVELSNLNRQVLFSEHDLGRRKVDAAVDRLRALNSDVDVIGTHTLIDDEQAIEDLVRGSDLFVHAIDKPKGVQGWSNSVSVRLGIPWSSSSYNGPMMASSMFIPGETGCFECMLMHQADRLRKSGDDDLLDHGAPENFNPVMAPTAQISGHFGAFEVIRYLTGMTVQTAGRQLHRSFLDYDHQYYTEAPPRPDCKVCGGRLVSGGR